MDSSTCFQIMDTEIQLTQYGMMAEKHWREFLPKMVAEMEAKGILKQMLLEAEQSTKNEMFDLTTQFIEQGMSQQEAHSRAWEMVREEYIFLPPESQKVQNRETKPTIV